MIGEGLHELIDIRESDDENGVPRQIQGYSFGENAEYLCHGQFEVFDVFLAVRVCKRAFEFHGLEGDGGNEVGEVCDIHLVWEEGMLAAL